MDTINQPTPNSTPNPVTQSPVSPNPAPTPPANTYTPPPVHEIPSSENPFQTYSSAGGGTTVVSSVEKTKAKIDKKIIIFGVGILVLGGLVFGITNFTGLFSKAAGDGDCAPVGPAEANLTANSIEITFSTAKACQTVISYGTSAQPESLLLEVPEAMASLNHRFKLSPLLPSTTYYYQVKTSEGKAVGAIRNFLTLRSESSQPAQQPASQPSTVPTVRPTTAPASSGSGTKTFEDFQMYFGTANTTYDINKDGIVNYADWSAYQKSSN